MLYLCMFYLYKNIDNGVYKNIYNDMNINIYNIKIINITLWTCIRANEKVQNY